ncbi:MAG: hypothetical protein AAF513_14970 [Pseudomonadota bacterium]
MRRVVAFLAAVVATYITAVIAYTQLNLGALIALGMPVDAGVRLEATLHDLLGMTPIYLPVVVVALLLGFAVSTVVIRFVPQLRRLGFIVGGFVALMTVEFALGLLMGTHPLAVTRTTVGWLSQCIAGAIGGYVFTLVQPAPQR